MAAIFPLKFPFAPISTIFDLQGKRGMPSWMAMTKKNFEWPFSKWPTFSRQNFHLLRFQWFFVYRGNRVCRVEWQWRKKNLSVHFQNGRHFPANFCFCSNFNDFWFTWETWNAEFYGNDENIFGATIFIMADIFPVFITFTQISTIFSLYGKQGMLSLMTMLCMWMGL